MVPLGAVGQFIDPFEVDAEQPPHSLRRRTDVVQEHVLVAVVCTHAYDVALVADDVDQLKLLEHRRQRAECLANLRPRFDGDTDWWTTVVEVEADKGVRDRPD